MKKPFLLLSLLLTFGLHADCAAWGTVGHRAIAEVAQRHLTPKAKAAIERYTGSTRRRDRSGDADRSIEELP